MVSENGYVWLQLSTAPCRHGGSTTSTAAATYLRRSSRWAGLHKSNDQFSHNRSNCTAGWVWGGDLEGVSGPDLQLLLSAPCRPATLELPMDENLSGWNELFLTARLAAQLQLQPSQLCCLYLTNHSWQSDVFATNSDAICFPSVGFPGRPVLEAPEGGVLWEAGGVHGHHGRNSSTDRWHLPDLK